MVRPKLGGLLLRVSLPLAVFVLATACTSIDPATLTLIGTASSDGAFADNIGPVPVDAHSGATTSTTTTTVASVLDATVDGTTVIVDHRDVTGSCQGDWTAEPTPMGHTLALDYVDASSWTRADDCLWDFSYTIDGLPAGTWQLSAKGQRFSVTIP